MCLLSKILWCSMLLHVASSSESQENSMNGDKQSDSSTVRYDLLLSSMKFRNDETESIRCNSCEYSVKNFGEMQYEPNINSTKNNHKNDDSIRYESRRYIKDSEESNQMSVESGMNFIESNDSMLQEIKNLSKIEDESNSTSYEYRNFNIQYHNNNRTFMIVPFEGCMKNITCIPLCCPYNYNLTIMGECVPAGKGSYSFPDFYKHGNDSEDKMDQPLYLTIYKSCFSQGFEISLRDHDEYLFFLNGSLLLKDSEKYIPRTSYCLGIFDEDIYDVMTCTDETDEIDKFPIYVTAFLLVSLPFLLLTFVVYSILPELQNIHGYVLRAYVASLFVTYPITYYVYYDKVQYAELVETKIICTILAYIHNFSYLSGFFWLNVMSFNIWWTFRKLRSCRTIVKKGKKKFVIYSIYAWGVALILNVICAIIDNVPVIQEISWIPKPKICLEQYWFGDFWAEVCYRLIPIGATVVSNIYFFIATAVTILYQNIRINYQLRDSESNRYNENKHRFILYLKLFIVMGMSWVMEILGWIDDKVHLMPHVYWYPFLIINGSQGLIIFIILVCRKKIMRQLQKRFDGKGCGPFKIPTYNENTASNTNSISSSRTMPMKEIGPSNQQPVSPSSINPTRSTATQSRIIHGPTEAANFWSGKCWLNNYLQ